MKSKRILLLGLVFIVAMSLAGMALASAAKVSANQNTSASSAINFQVVETPDGGLMPAEILLVDDDDNIPNVLPTYVQILEALGYSYHIWDTGNSDVEPDLATLSQYRAVIWFSGDELGGAAGPSSTSEAELAAYLDSGACMFLSSQDYFKDRGLTPFMQNYLGVANVSNDLGDYLAVQGVGSVYSNLGPYSLTYPFTDYSDIVVPDTSAQLAFQGISPNTNPAGIYKDGGVFKTTFLGFPLEAIPSIFDQSQVVSRFLLDCFDDDVMLVDDDDNDPDVLSYYSLILDQLGVHYSIWDTDNSDSEPSAADLASYEAVVWFTGDEFGGFAGPGAQSETELANWLDNNNACFFLSSQDYLYDRGLTSFMATYLGVEGGVSDVVQTVVTGTFGYGGLGPYTLTLPISLTNYSDVFTPTVFAEEAFMGDQSAEGTISKTFGLKDQVLDLRVGSSPSNSSEVSFAAGVYNVNALYQTTWLGFPFEALPTSLDQLRTMHRFLANCFPSDLQTTKTTSDPVVDQGETFTYTVSVVNHGPHRATNVIVQDFIPAQVNVEAVYVSPAVTCSPAPNANLTCSIGEMAVGQQEDIQIVVTPTSAGGITNFAFATNFGADPDPADNSTSVFVRVLAPGDTSLYLDRVTPNTSENTTNRNLQILGANFQSDTQLYLNGELFITRTFDSDYPDAIISATLPVGFQPGSYNIQVENITNTDAAGLFNGLVVYDPSSLSLDAMTPPIGPNDRPVVLDLFGNGFSPETGVKLIDSNNSQIYYPLLTAGLISEHHVRAIVPYGVTAGTYDVEVFNPQGYTDTLTSAYQALEWSTADDLFAMDFDIYTIPASPREGQDVTVGLTVRRRTGDYAFYDKDPVTVTVEMEISLDGTPVSTLNHTEIISPNSTISTTFPWTADSAGDYVLTFNLTSPELNPDTVPENNVVSRTVEVLPPSTDIFAPEILNVTVNSGAIVTNKPQIVINTSATDIGSGTAYIYYIDYAFDRNLGDWMPVKRVGWIPFENGVDVDALLESTTGVHYIQAWVSDHAGNVSQPKSTFINLIPPKNGIVHDGGQVFRLYLPPGVNMQIDLTSLVGDADIFAWNSGGDLVAAAFGSNPFEQININAGANPPGIYQIDVYGFDDTSYWFEASFSLTQEDPAATDEVQGHVKGSDTPLQVVDNNPGEDVNFPFPPTGWTIYLPIAIR